MAIQRTEFELITGINRPGDPVDVIVPSEPRQMPKAADLGGAQCRITFDAPPPAGQLWGITLEGTNMIVPGSDFNNPTIDPNAEWVLAALPTFPITEASVSPAVRMVDAVDQIVKLLPFVFIRATWINLNVEATPAGADNFEARVFMKLDYITG